MKVVRKISSSCGMDVEVKADDMVNGWDVASELEGGRVDYEAIFLLRGDGRYELIGEGMEEKRRQ